MKSAITLVLLLACPGWADPGLEPSKALLEGLNQLGQTARMRPDVFGERFQSDLAEVTARARQGDLTTARRLLGRAVQRQACALSGGKSDFPVPQAAPTPTPTGSPLEALATQKPEVVKQLAASLLARTQDRFLDTLARKAALDPIETRYLAKKPKAPQTAAEIRRQAREARAVLDQPEALNPTVLDTPQGKRDHQATRATRLKALDDAEALALRTLPSRQKAYEQALAQWKGPEARHRDQERERVLATGRDELLRTPELRQAWEAQKAGDSGMTRISNALGSLRQAAASDTRVALALLQAQPVLSALRSYADQWIENRLEFPEQARRARQHGIVFEKLAGRVLADARKGQVRNIGVYSAPEMAELLTGYGIERGQREVEDAAWFAADAVAAAALAVGTLGAGGPAAAALLATAGLTETGASIVHQGQRKNPDAGLWKQLSDPEIAPHALLFVLTLPAAQLGQLTRSAQFERSVVQLFRDSSRARRFIDASRAAAALLEKGKHAYFTVQGAAAIPRAVQECRDGAPETCLSTLGLALLQLMPQGIETYRATRASSCRALAAQEPEATCKPGPETLPLDPKRLPSLPFVAEGPAQELRAHAYTVQHSLDFSMTETLLDGVSSRRPRARALLTRFRSIKTANEAQGRTLPDRAEVEAARALRDELLKETGDTATGTRKRELVAWLDSKYNLEAEPKPGWSPHPLMEELHKLDIELNAVYHSMKTQRDLKRLKELRMRLSATRARLEDGILNELIQQGTQISRRPGGLMVITPSETGTLLNRFAKKIQDKFGIRVVYDLDFLIKHPQTEALYTDGDLHLPTASLLSGRPDLVVGHEIIHGILSGKEKTGFLRSTMNSAEADVPGSILSGDKNPAIYGNYYTHQEYVAWSYTLRSNLTRLANPRITAEEQRKSRMAVYDSLLVLDKLARSDQQVFGQMLKEVQAADPTQIDENLGTKLTARVYVDTSSAMNRQQAILGDFQGVRGTVLASREVEMARIDLQSAHLAYTTDKSLNRPAEKQAATRERLIRARAKMKLALEQALSSKLAIAREIQHQVDEARTGLMVRQADGELKVDLNSGQVQALRKSAGQKPPEELQLQLLKPVEAIERLLDPTGGN